MKPIAFSIVILACLESARRVSSQEELSTGEEKQQEKPLRLIQSVNPSPQMALNVRQQSVGTSFDLMDKEVSVDRVSSKRLGVFMPLARSLSPGTDYSSETEQIDEDDKQDKVAEIQVDKRSWKTRDEREKIATRREAVMNLLLQELPMLDISGVNGFSDSRKSRQRQQQQPQQQEQPTMPTNSELAVAAAMNPGNRLRGRSAFVMNGGPNIVGAHLATPSFQMVPASLIMDVGVNTFPKRAPNHHVPCFFNAITCF